MGSFEGHAVPGTFFIVFGLWCIVQTFRRYYWALETRSKFKATASYPADFLCGRWKTWPVEGMVKMISAAIGAVIEVSSAKAEDGSWEMGNFQHTTMYLTFGLNGLIDVLTHFRGSPVEGADYLSFALALTVEGVLFKFHLMGRTGLDTLVHTLLLYVIAVAVVMTLVEMAVLRHHVMAPFSRGYFLLLQGTWFWQVGAILYNPVPGAEPWRQEDHEQMMMATLYFSWHAGADFVIALLIGTFVACRHRQGTLYQVTELKVVGAGYRPQVDLEEEASDREGPDVDAADKTSEDL